MDRTGTSASPRAESGTARRGGPGPRDGSVRVLALDGGAPIPAELVGAWRALLTEHEGPISPFLDPVFTEAVAASRTDVELVVAFEGGRPTTFLPLHRTGRHRTAAVGGRLSDVQGPVIESRAVGTAESQLQAAGIRSWRFARALESPWLPARCRWAGSRSQVVDLDGGFDAYASELRRGGSRQLEQAFRKARKLEREVGALRFEFETDDASVLDRLLEWKSEQRARTGAVDPFRQRWARPCVDRLHRGGSPLMRGVLSALWAGDQLVAAHFGLLNDAVCHWWIPAYDPRFGPYSPGLVLIANLMREIAGRGVVRLDLGHGEERYKSSFATSSYPLYSGAVEQNGLRRGAGRAAARTREAIRGTRLEPGWQAVKRAARRLSDQG